MVKTFLKILWLQFLVPHSEQLLVSSATLLCKTQNILTLSLLVYTIREHQEKTFVTLADFGC